MISGIDDPEIIEEAKSLGADDYLVKPILLDRLEEKVLSMANGTECDITGGSADA